jgi:hypothetical protein
MSDLNFESLALLEEPVKIAGDDYVLVEASEDAIAKYRDAIRLSNYVEFNEDGKAIRSLSNPKAQGPASQESLLLSMCLFHEAKPAVNGKDATPRVPVSLVAIKKWPRRVTAVIFDACERMNKLGDYAPKTPDQERGELGQSKNSPTATP